jgi:hypothetical protein
LAYWVFGILLSGALTVAVGRSLVAEHGRKWVPALCVFALLFGLLIGWAINGYIDYVNASATMRFSGAQ